VVIHLSASHDPGTDYAHIGELRRPSIDRSAGHRLQMSVNRSACGDSQRPEIVSEHCSRKVLMSAVEMRRRFTRRSM
jgi:hypothetical protein